MHPWIETIVNLFEAGDDGGELDEPLVDLLPPPPLRDYVVLHVPRRRRRRRPAASFLHRRRSGGRGLGLHRLRRRWNYSAAASTAAILGGRLRRRRAEVPAHRPVPPAAAAAAGDMRGPPGGGRGGGAAWAVAGAPAVGAVDLVHLHCQVPESTAAAAGRRGVAESLQRREGVAGDVSGVGCGGGVGGELVQRVHSPLHEEAGVIHVVSLSLHCFNNQIYPIKININKISV